MDVVLLVYTPVPSYFDKTPQLFLRLLLTCSIQLEESLPRGDEEPGVRGVITSTSVAGSRQDQPYGQPDNGPGHE